MCKHLQSIMSKTERQYHLKDTLSWLCSICPLQCVTPQNKLSTYSMISVQWAWRSWSRTLWNKALRGGFGCSVWPGKIDLFTLKVKYCVFYVCQFYAKNLATLYGHKNVGHTTYLANTWPSHRYASLPHTVSTMFLLNISAQALALLWVNEIKLP